MKVPFKYFYRVLVLIAICVVFFAGFLNAFPEELILSPDDYADKHVTSLVDKLFYRIHQQPFNLVASLIFLASIVHIFFSNQIRQHAEKLLKKSEDPESNLGDYQLFLIELLMFCGEVEMIFGIWAIPLLCAMAYFFDWGTVINYLNSLNYTEPLFVVVIMIIASTTPIIQFANKSLLFLTNSLGGSVKVRWATLLTVGPLLGSVITEPGAMTLTALLLGRQFYLLQPSLKLAYATLGLLFVNISVGGVLTSFAAPPVLMVAQKWGWDTIYMLTHFGYKAIIGIILSVIAYALFFRSEFANLQRKSYLSEDAEEEIEDHVPTWVTLIHIGFLIAIIFASHFPIIFSWIFLIFLGFYQASHRHQTPLKIKESLLVGFFLAGLVVHGSMQGWWVAPVLKGVSQNILMLVAAGLSAFVDNAGITYLTTLVPNLSQSLKHAVVAGAVIGGGLTVIANAPNPVGQSILGKYFAAGISPLKLAAAALCPTIIMFLVFYFF